jgi:hypothetical protein
MKVKVDSILRAENLVGGTPEKPIKGLISFVAFIEAKDLGFKSEEGRYEVTVNINGEEWDWMPNKTSLKVLIKEFGDESDKWDGKTIGLYALDQSVAGELKKVTYAIAIK